MPFAPRTLGATCNEMRGLNVLIKPASDACNMACAYCFYRDVAQRRQDAFMGMLSVDRMEHLIMGAMEAATEYVGFAFQGGEPTLAGLDFYRQAVALQKKHQKKGVAIHNSIQTNGYCIDEEWAAFFHENHFLVGLSLDGPAHIHNLNRLDYNDKGTFNRAMHTARLFDKHQVEYNILSVVTGYNARHIRQVYRFFAKEKMGYLQFIPCLEPLDAVRGEAAYHLSVEAYGRYLVDIWDLWYQDLKKGQYTSIRHIDNWMSIVMGRQPEACSMMGRCTTQFVVEGDGSVYPCDFFVTDEWRLGNVEKDSFETLWNSENAKRFMESSLHVDEECKGCKWYPLCRCGCRRDRVLEGRNNTQVNYYCSAYRHFFDSRYQEMCEAAQRIQTMG